MSLGLPQSSQSLLFQVAAARDAGFIVARDPEGGAGVPGHVVLAQTRAALESKQHVRLARQLASNGRVMPLPEIPAGSVPNGVLQVTNEVTLREVW